MQSQIFDPILLRDIFNTFLQHEKKTQKDQASGLEQMKWPFEGFKGIYTESIHESTRIKLYWGYLWEDKIRELLRNTNNR